MIDPLTEHGAGIGKLLRVVVLQEIQRTDDLVFMVEAEKCLYQILLVPETDFTAEPSRLVILGRANIMNMHEYARLEYRQYLQIFEQYIALRPDHMRRIDEQNVALFELPENIEIDLLDRSANEFDI